MITQDQIRELRELHAKATQGGWKAVRSFAGDMRIRSYATQWPAGSTVAVIDKDPLGSTSSAIAESVAAFHNAAPDLLDAAEGAIRLRELVKVMREELGVMLNQVNDMEWVGLDGAAFLKKVHATRALASKEVAS